jgi:DNA-binding NarL/FixJ family response regulator
MGLIKVLLLDNREIPREALVKLLEDQGKIEVVSQCSTIDETLKEIKRVRPELVLVDSNLSRCNSDEAARRINESAPKVKVAVLTDSKEQKDLVSAIESGATGYLHKESTVTEFIESIDLINKGGLVVSPQIAEKLGDRLSSMPADNTQEGGELSDREVEIVRMLARGATNKEISGMLFITENTVKVHLKNILSKLGLRNRQQIVAYAVQQGLATDLTESVDKPG